MSQVLIGSISSLMPAFFSSAAAKRRLSTKVARSVVVGHAGRRLAGEAVQLRHAERGRVLDGLRHAGAELVDPVRQAGDAALAGVPVAGRQVVQHQLQAVGVAAAPASSSAGKA